MILESTIGLSDRETGQDPLLTIDFDVSRADIAGLAEHNFRTGRGRALVIWETGLVLASAFLTVGWLWWSGSSAAYLAGTATMVFTIAGVLLLKGVPAWNRFLVPWVSEFGASASRALGHWEVDVTPSGLVHRHSNGCGSIRWASLTGVECDGGAVYVYIDRRNAYVIPSSAFSGEAHLAEFSGAVETFILQARRDSTTP